MIYAEFDIQKDSVCGAPMFVEFINNSTGNIDNVWYVNGSILSQDPNFNHIFGSASTNNISLIVIKLSSTCVELDFD